MATFRLASRLASHTVPRAPFVHSVYRRQASTSTTTRSVARTVLYVSAFTVSAGLFAVYYLDARSALHRYCLTPIIRHALDAETGHKLSVRILMSGLAPRDPLPDHERLRVQLWGQELRNPVGLAAGFDKDGEAIDGLFDLGFSWVEIGSVTPRPQAGNPRPRVFHLTEDSALINRYGFPSRGHAYVLSRVRERIPAFNDSNGSAAFRDGSLLAVNLGKNKDSPAESIEDFVIGVKSFAPYSDALVINVSSPNTPGLRGLQNRKQLENLLQGVIKARDQAALSIPTSRKPRLLLKVSPDLDEPQLVDIADVIKSNAIDGVIVSNTTVCRPPSLLGLNKGESGGLSGPPLKEHALAALRTLRSHLPAAVPLIGCGGISTGADALEFAKAGASFVQIYTSFGYDGVGTCRRIKDELVEELEKNDTTWSKVVHDTLEQLSLKPTPMVEEHTASAIQQLIKEAEDLKKSLDQLGREMEMDRLVDSLEEGALKFPL